MSKCSVIYHLSPLKFTNNSRFPYVKEPLSPLATSFACIGTGTGDVEHSVEVPLSNLESLLGGVQIFTGYGNVV